MALPDFSMRQLLEAGVHFGHQTHRWNPKMGNYIFGTRNNVHIIDLSLTVPMLHTALRAISDTVAQGGRVLFVGTKRQAANSIAESARQSAQYFVNSRWLGGMLTNWKTISQSIHRLRQLEEMVAGDLTGLTKKERLNITRNLDKLETTLGGIKDMGGIPDLLFVVDTNKEAIAVQEARRLGIPVAAIIDSNSNPDNITYPIPGNDDAARAVSLYCDLVARAAIDGISRGQSSIGIDIGAAEDIREEPAIKVKAETQPVAQDNATEKAEKAEKAEKEAVDSTSDEQPASTSDDEGSQVAAYQGLDAPKGEADDLTKISGVGPVIVEKLHELGVYHFWQIAELNSEQITAIDDRLNFKGRIEREDWIGQAKTLLES